MISSVYNNKNNIPVNKQAVKEFFKDHELHSDPLELAVKPPPALINIEYFKKAPADMKLAISIDSDINMIDYERATVALSKTKDKPIKISRLARYIQHMNGGKKKYALLIVNNMSKQGFIKIIGDEVVYF